MAVSPPKEQFGKFVSNSIGDPYVDPGKYRLRSRSPVEQPFVSMHGHRTVKKSEYEHMSEKKLAPVVEQPRGLYNRKTSEPFTNLNQLGYSEDPYERKEDLARDEYARLNGKILHRGQPFSHVVRQHGTFYPNMLTFGTTKQFPEKRAPSQTQPLYGPFRKGDPAHVGYNKTFGGHGKSSELDYVEQCEQDPVRFHPSGSRQPVWRDTASMSKSMMSAPVHDNRRNVSHERSQIFG